MYGVTGNIERDTWRHCQDRAVDSALECPAWTSPRDTSMMVAHALRTVTASTVSLPT
jgi:hypothetical protein